MSLAVLLPGSGAATRTRPDSAPATVLDTTSADFSAGAVDAGAYVAETADGEVILAPTFGAEFSGDALPAGMSATLWFPPNGSAKVAGGRLTLDGARAGTDALFGPGRSLEFSADITQASLDSSGFGQTFMAAPWVVFRTGFFVFNLMTGTNGGTSQNSSPIPSTVFRSPRTRTRRPPTCARCSATSSTAAAT